MHCWLLQYWETNAHLFFSHDVYEILIPPPPNSSVLNSKKEKYQIFNNQYFQKWRYNQDVSSLFQVS